MKHCGRNIDKEEGGGVGSHPTMQRTVKQFHPVHRRLVSRTFTDSGSGFRSPEPAGTDRLFDLFSPGLCLGPRNSVETLSGPDEDDEKFDSTTTLSLLLSLE